MKTYRLKGEHLSKRLKLKDIAHAVSDKAVSESAIELVYKHTDDSYVFIFHFGSMVFINVPEEKQKTYVELVEDVHGPLSRIPAEDFVVEEDSTLQTHETGFNKVKVKNLTYPVLRMLTMVIAESTALDYFENITEELLNNARKISSSLKLTGSSKMSMKQMIRFVGDCLATQQEIITDLYIVDAPDETWEDQELDRLYADVKKTFEIETRYRVLEYKLKLVQETVEVILDLLRFRRQTFLEMVIIGLITVEVAWLIVQILR